MTKTCFPECGGQPHAFDGLLSAELPQAFNHTSLPCASAVGAYVLARGPFRTRMPDSRLPISESVISDLAAQADDMLLDKLDSDLAPQLVSLDHAYLFWTEGSTGLLPRAPSHMLRHLKIDAAPDYDPLDVDDDFEPLPQDFLQTCPFYQKNVTYNKGVSSLAGVVVGVFLPIAACSRFGVAKMAWCMPLPTTWARAMWRTSTCL